MLRPKSIRGRLNVLVSLSGKEKAAQHVVKFLPDTRLSPTPMRDTADLPRVALAQLLLRFMEARRESLL